MKTLHFTLLIAVLLLSSCNPNQDARDQKLVMEKSGSSQVSKIPQVPRAYVVRQADGSIWFYQFTVSNLEADAVQVLPPVPEDASVQYEPPSSFTRSQEKTHNER